MQTKNSTKILGKKILFITSHPDDESFLAGGTILKNFEMDGENYLFCATLGEAGKTHIKLNLNEIEIKSLRKQELENACKYLNIHEFYAGTLPDGKLYDNKTIIHKEILEFIQSTKPEIIISFGIDGYTGHKDHIATGEIAKNIAKDLSISFFEFSQPPINKFENFFEYLKPKRMHGKYIEDFEEHNPDIHIEVNPEQKMKVLEIYQSQLQGLNPYNIFPEDIALHILSNEYFKKVT